jgi:hypothetical protein
LRDFGERRNDLKIEIVHRAGRSLIDERLQVGTEGGQVGRQDYRRTASSGSAFARTRPAIIAAVGFSR